MARVLVIAVIGFELVGTAPAASKAIPADYLVASASLNIRILWQQKGIGWAPSAMETTQTWWQQAYRSRGSPNFYFTSPRSCNPVVTDRMWLDSAKRMSRLLSQARVYHILTKIATKH